MTAFYNELDPYAAQWLRNLIDAGHIAPGVVDSRSIEDITPGELDGYSQCHFFAGVGVWSLALRRAGWPDDKPVWTGSCPCQPFSAAGKRAGTSDERHLWPSFNHLISYHQPAVVLGEQVASKDANTWIDLVQADVEALGYSFGCLPFPSAGIGAPHIRDRAYWLADSECSRDWRKLGDGAGTEAAAQGRGPQDSWPDEAGDRSATRVMADTMQSGRTPRRPIAGDGQTTSSSSVEWLANNNNKGLEGYGEPGQQFGAQGWQVAQRYAGQDYTSGGVANTDGRDAGTERLQRSGQHRQQQEVCRPVPDIAAGPVNGIWRAADWLFCRDGKWRPVEPGTFPLAHGAASRVGRLRAYGNAINVEAAKEFILAYQEAVALKGLMQ